MLSAIDYQKIINSAGINDARLRYTSTHGMGTGVSNTRNVGLSQSTAQSITYLDADDALMPDYLEKMVPLARHHGLALANHQLMDDREQKIASRFSLPRPEGLIQLKDLPQVTCSHCCSTIVYTRARVPTRWITNLSMIEDAAFLFQTFDHLDGIFSIAEPLYLYYQHPDSLTNHPTAASHFIGNKQMLLDKICAGDMFKNPRAATIAKPYFEQSIAAEQEYLHSRITNPHIDFLEIFARRLKEQHLL